jgi:zinc transport system substrate-binding protein
LQWLVEQVGGESVEVSALVGPGQSPATYEPTPRQMATLTDSRLYVRVGVPFERAWLDRITAASPGMSVLDLREGLKLRAMESSGHRHGEGPGREALDPHVWTSPTNLIHMARVLRDRLIELDPERESAYRRNHQRLVCELEALDHEIRDRLEVVGAKRFLVYHPSWGYFADTYGLEQIPIEHEGKAPGPRSLAALVERARAENLDTILVQRQFDQRTAQTLADAIGARVRTVDPLAYDLPESLRQVADYIAGDAP